MNQSTPEPASCAPLCLTPPAEQERWFRQEVHPHDGQLKAYLRGAFPGVRDVDDVVQESYLRIWKARLARPIRSTKSFLFQVARHLAIDALRRKKSAAEESSVDWDTLPVLETRLNPAAALTHRERIDLLCDALASLPERTREIVFLRKFQSVPQKQVAAQFGISERTVEARLDRGMKLCASFLIKHGVQGFTRDES